MFELFEGRDWMEFIGWSIAILGVGGIIGALIVGSAAEKGSITAVPIGWQPLQQLIEKEECNSCLPRCFQVYNLTRSFGKTVAAVENGWIK
jgi:hypothetical protein